jgi:hypothetical protein
MTEDYQPLSPEEGYRCALRLLDRLEGSDTSHLEPLEGIDEGPCEQCGRGFARARVRLGQAVLCLVCARQRVRLAARLKDAA